MIIEVGEFLHSYIAAGILVFIGFLLGTQVGGTKNEHKKSN